MLENAARRTEYREDTSMFRKVESDMNFAARERDFNKARGRQIAIDFAVSGNAEINRVERFHIFTSMAVFSPSL